MIKIPVLAALAMVWAAGAAACPADKVKGTTASGEAAMSKPSSKFSKTHKAAKPVTADNAELQARLQKPKA